MDWNTVLAHVTWASSLVVVAGMVCVVIGLVAYRKAMEHLAWEQKKYHDDMEERRRRDEADRERRFGKTA